MNTRFIPITLLISASLFAACSSTAEEPKREVVKFDGPEATKPNEEVSNTAQPDVVEQTHGTTITSNTTVVPAKSELVLADSSKVTTTKDDAGNKVETRVFGKNSAISQIVVSTGPDGQKKVELYYNNAASKSAKGDAADLVLSEPASELESRFGLKPAATTTVSNAKAIKDGSAIDPAHPMTRAANGNPGTKSEMPASQPKLVQTIPQLPPVRTARSY
jgi:hypothetical protein